MLADEALQASDWVIEKADALESPERWLALSSRTYRQLAQARAALLRLNEALRGLDKRLIGVQTTCKINGGAQITLSGSFPKS